MRGRMTADPRQRTADQPNWPLVSWSVHRADNTNGTNATRVVTRPETTGSGLAFTAVVSSTNTAAVDAAAAAACNLVLLPVTTASGSILLETD
jgi:hypothetical protein